MAGLVRSLGPGLVAGASDNDPTTVATLAVIGATTGYGLAWLMLLVIPMLMVVQVISASVGVVARGGLEDVVRRRYGEGWALFTLVLVLAVTLITLAADLEGGAAALGLIAGASYRWFIAPFALAVGALLIWGSYGAVERILRYVVLVFVAYIATTFLARPQWGDVLRHTFVPDFHVSGAFVAGALALLGTTLTSYCYVWETIETTEESVPLTRLGTARVDAAVGMLGAGAVFYFILVGTGATLGAHHQSVQTAADAASALGPLAGRYATLLFGVGLLASAVLAVPVLAGTSAYVMAEAFGWRASLDARFATAPQFYVSLVLSLAVGSAITLFGVGPIQLLFFSSIAGGLGTPGTLIPLMLIARDRSVMRDHRIGRALEVGGWITVAVVSASCLVFLVQPLTGAGGS